jgi:hypothetical protein
MLFSDKHILVGLSDGKLSIGRIFFSRPDGRTNQPTRYVGSTSRDPLEILVRHCVGKSARKGRRNRSAYASVDLYSNHSVIGHVTRETVVSIDKLAFLIDR